MKAFALLVLNVLSGRDRLFIIHIINKFVLYNVRVINTVKKTNHGRGGYSFF